MWPKTLPTRSAYWRSRVLDAALQRQLQPVLRRMAGWLAQHGATANGLSWLGFGLGVAAAVAIALGWFGWGLALLLLSRLCDGLDGAVARQRGPTDWGAYLDITLDFLFYALVPLGFAWANPAQNALPAAVLLVAFVGTGSSFLAYAALAAKRGVPTRAHALPKGLHFVGGLTEATETLAVFAAMCLWPAQFALLAYGFAVLCGITVVTRLMQAKFLCQGD
jgi:phosphatidylglycerophosphate synthase